MNKEKYLLRFSHILQVEITDTDPDTLEQLLKYIYSDKLECDMPNLASSLMTAADKYNIPRLKSLCEESICNNIEVSNAADILVLAHMYEASNLKVMAIDFIMNNLDKVSETPGWTNITTGNFYPIFRWPFLVLNWIYDFFRTTSQITGWNVQNINGEDED